MDRLAVQPLSPADQARFALDGGSGDFDVAMLVVVSAALSLVLAVTVGATAGGLSWLATLLAAGILIGSKPLPRASVARSLPLIVLLGIGAASLYWTPDLRDGLQSLGQLALIPVCFIVGWRFWYSSRHRFDTLSNAALATMPLAVVVFAAAWSNDQFRFGWLVGNAARPMVIAMSALFVIGTIGRARWIAVAAGGWALLAALASGGRMGFLVILVLIVVSPAIGISRRMRLLLGIGALIAISAAIQTEAFQDRFFVGREQGSLTDILLLRGNLNTAGRADNWPRILDNCSQSPIVGSGIGSTERITVAATNGATIHPHNEFIRVFCDTGFMGSLAFWGFVVSCAWHHWRHWRNGADTTHLSAASCQLLFALIAFSLTDNVTVYTSAFVGPAFLVLGMAEAERYRLARTSESNLPVIA